MTARPQVHCTVGSAYALRQAAQDAASPLSQALRRDGAAVIHFKGFRFRCEWLAGKPPSELPGKETRITEVEFLHMSFRQAVARLFDRLPLRRLVAPLRASITEAAEDTRRAIAEGLRDRAAAAAAAAAAKDEPGAPQDPQTDAYLDRITAIELAHAGNAEARDNALGALWRTLLQGHEDPLRRHPLLSSTVLDDIRMRVWTAQTSQAIRALRGDQLFASSFMAAAAHCYGVELAVIDAQMAHAGKPDKAREDLDALARTSGPSALLDRIEQLPCELRAMRLADFRGKVLGPMSARLYGLGAGAQALALGKYVDALTKRVEGAQALLRANAANFEGRRAPPDQTQLRRWGPSARV